ncbi:hypothetical protein M5K25_024031 [Dendrobium thyrsiflorum]|uniref:Uncharacterized protein n=1 Tax=Dendrobium thyrsiflorum TaxID=117978 RepID=A0ABD0U0R4_DENTH
MGMLGKNVKDMQNKTIAKLLCITLEICRGSEGALPPGGVRPDTAHGTGRCGAVPSYTEFQYRVMLLFKEQVYKQVLDKELCQLHTCRWRRMARAMAHGAVHLRCHLHGAARRFKLARAMFAQCRMAQ